MSGLHINNLSKSYRTGSSHVHALADVSLDINPGEFIALHGASGSGKSTLLYTIAGLITPDAGTVSLKNETLTDMGASARTQHRAHSIGLVFQDFRLVPYLSVLDNAALTTQDHSKAEALLKKVKLENRLHHKPSQLSAGEQQRCAIARALANTPLLVLADEPTGNLDAENSTIILDYLADFASKGNIVIMATHDPAAVSATSRSIGMKEGKIQP